MLFPLSLEHSECDDKGKDLVDRLTASQHCLERARNVPEGCELKTGYSTDVMRSLS